MPSHPQSPSRRVIHAPATRHSAVRAFSALTAIAAFLLAGAPARAADGVLPLDAEQMRRLGVGLEKIAAPAAGASLADGLRLAGTVQAPPSAQRVVSAPAAGVVDAVLVQPMDTAAAGKPLATLRSPQALQWQREYLQAALTARLAQDKAARDAELHAEGIVSQSRLQESRAAWQQAEAARRELQQVLRIAGLGTAALDREGGERALSERLPVAAPQAGVVTEQLVEVGERVEAGAPLFRLAASGRLWLALSATREQAAALRTGDEVGIEGCEQPGRLLAISPELKADSQTVSLRAELPRGCGLPNQQLAARVKARAGSTPALQVKTAALASLGGKTHVFVRTKGGFRPVPVEVVLRDTATALVRGTLAAGDEVAVSGVASLKGIWLGMGVEEAK